jgi:ribonuclease HI
MCDVFLFFDGSVHSKTKIGCGTCLLVVDKISSLDVLKTQIQTKYFYNTSSTKLELQTFLWAIKEVKIEGEIVVFTDSQNIIRLLERREYLEKNQYQTAKNKLHNLHDLYKDFYKIIDQISCKFIKIKGHMPSKQKNNFEEIFTLVDKASRNGVRKLNVTD